MPPPPPPSASSRAANLVIEDSSSSSEEEEVDEHTDYYRRRNHYINMMVAGGDVGAASHPSTRAVRNHGNGLLSHNHDNDRNFRINPPQDEMEVDDELITMQVDDKQCRQIEDETMIEATTDNEAKKKKRKKKKKKKKAKKKSINSTMDEQNDGEVDDMVETEIEDGKLFTAETSSSAADATQHQPPKSTPGKSISFGTVSVEQYARTLGTHVVPLDGGWPLGLSNRVVVPAISVGHATKTDYSMGAAVGGLSTANDTMSSCATPSSSPTSQLNWGRNSPQPLSPKNNLSSFSPLSMSSSCKIPTTSPITFAIDDFEARKQLELQQRYIQLIRDQRRRKFEKEWERRNMHKNIHNTDNQHNTRRFNAVRGRSVGGKGGGKSGGGSGGRNSTSSGSFKMEMSVEGKEELERILNQPIMMPAGELETRPFDYRKKICRILKQRNSSTTNNKNCHGDNNIENNDVVTEEEELYHEQGGRNPLFATLSENARRKVLLRDDHLMNICQVISDDNANIMMNDESNPLDPTDTAITQYIQHELETLRIQRSDPANLGCSCRKLHIFLQGSIDKSHQKKKGSHRRMPERKVCEELRRRGLLNKSNENMSREKLEILLHDTIENEPCCWGNDCPCVRNGIGCQADTCTCWHDSHDATHGASYHQHPKIETHDQGVEVMKSRCGNANGIYIVNFEEIAKYRKRYVTTQVATESSDVDFEG